MAVTLQNGFLFISNNFAVANLYVFIYLILLIIVFGLFFNFQLKSSNIDFRTLKNPLNYHSNSQYRYYFLYLGLIFPIAEVFYLIFNESKSINSYYEFLIGAFCVFIFIITSKKEIAKYSYIIFSTCFYLLLASAIYGLLKESLNFILFSKYLLLLFFAFSIFKKLNSFPFLILKCAAWRQIILLGVIVFCPSFPPTQAPTDAFSGENYMVQPPFPAERSKTALQQRKAPSVNQ